MGVNLLGRELISKTLNTRKTLALLAINTVFIPCPVWAFQVMSSFLINCCFHVLHFKFSFYAAELVLALRYLHGQGIIYR